MLHLKRFKKITQVCKNVKKQGVVSWHFQGMRVCKTSIKLKLFFLDYKTKDSSRTKPPKQLVNIKLKKALSLKRFEILLVKMDQRQKRDNKKNKSMGLQSIQVKAWSKSSASYQTDRKQRQNQKSSRIIALLVIKVRVLNKYISWVLDLIMHPTKRK